MKIKIDDLTSGEVISLLEEHLADMYATSPAKSVHALDINALKDASITFYSCWNNATLLGCVALRELDASHAELKSMRTASNARQLGVASTLMTHILTIAKQRDYKKISLETGSMDFFQAARQLYTKFGFQYCGPFGDYHLDANSKFMTRKL